MQLYIQKRGCPACHNQRTVDFERWGSNCFNCGRNWQAASRELAQRTIAADDWLLDVLSEAGMRTPATVGRGCRRVRIVSGQIECANLVAFCVAA